MQGCRNGTEPSDEAPIKVGEPQELLNLLPAFWGWPFSHGANLGQSD